MLEEWRGRVGTVVFPVIELDADGLTCSPHGMYLTMNTVAETGGEGGETVPHSSAN